MIREFNLGDSIGVRVLHFAPIAVGVEIYRIIYEIRAIPTNAILKEYEIWVSDIYVEDHEKLDQSASLDEVLNFANGYLKLRYKRSENTIPKENGAYLTNETGEIRGNPRTFPLKRISDKPRFVKTTLQLPPETHKWIIEYGKEKGIGMGETIRRVVADFQAGTASYVSQELNQVNNNAGAVSIKNSE